MAKVKIKEAVNEILREFLMENKLEIYLTDFVKEGKDWFLRVYIDKAQEEDGYISIDDCEKVSRFLNEKLDEMDAIEQAYYLEVSSPGMDRTLCEPKHFERYINCKVDISFYKAVDGAKQGCFILADYNDGNIVVKDESGEHRTFKKEEVAKVKLAI